MQVHANLKFNKLFKFNCDQGKKYRPGYKYNLEYVNLTKALSQLYINE